MQVTQLQVFVLLCDLIALQDSPSSGPNIAVDHSQSLAVLLRRLPAEAPLATAARSMTTILCSGPQDNASLESALLEFVMQEQASACVVASCVAHYIAQGNVAAACKGVLQAVQRFGDESEPVLACLLSVKVRALCYSTK